MIWILVSGIVTAIAGWLGTSVAKRLCANIEPLPDGPQAASPPVVALVIGSGVLGAVMAWRGVSVEMEMLVVVLAFALSAASTSDFARGVVPDLFTLAPLAIVLAFAFVHHGWGIAYSALIPSAPFALSAVASRGIGMGWGDVKLVALGGAVLGVQLSLLALALACIGAIVLHYVRGGAPRPIAFAPYLTLAIAAAMPFGALV